VLPEGALKAAEEADGPELQPPGRAHGGRHHERPSREHDTWDFGIA
jgi:hypothetical protein